MKKMLIKELLMTKLWHAKACIQFLKQIRQKKAWVRCENSYTKRLKFDEKTWTRNWSNLMRKFRDQNSQIWKENSNAKNLKFEKETQSRKNSSYKNLVIKKLESDEKIQTAKDRIWWDNSDTKKLKFDEKTQIWKDQIWWENSDKKNLKFDEKI